MVRITKEKKFVEVISPSTPCSFDDLEKIKNFLQKNNFTPRIHFEKETTLPATSQARRKISELVFSAQIRCKQLEAAINSDAKIIWCARGGYGSAEMLPFLRKLKKPKQNKIFIGFSDITAITTFLQQKWGWKIIAAPMLRQISSNKVSKKSQKAIIDVALGKKTEASYNLIALNKACKTKKTIEGTLVGGCLSVLSSNFATENQINWHNKILFLEDIDESAERLDRYFYQIFTMICENKSSQLPKAILLGNFFQGYEKEPTKIKSIENKIALFAQRLDFLPMFREKTNCLGHSKNMMPLVIGAEAKISGAKILTQKISTF